MAEPEPIRDRGALSDRWIRWVLLHHRVILLGAALLTLVMGGMAMQLQIIGDLRALLPPDHTVVRSLEQIESSLGSTNSVNVVAKGGTPEARHAFTDALAERLRDDPLFRDVEQGLPSQFFSEHALYYLDDAEMEGLEQRVDAWTHYQMCSAQPDACLTDPDPEAPRRLREFIEDKRETAYQRTGFRDRYEREGVDAEILLAHPHGSSSDLNVAREVSTRVREVAREIYGSSGPWQQAGMDYNIIGPYVTKADEHQTILRDMLRGGIFAFIGVVGILYFLFRSRRAVIVLLVPLLCGVTWSLGATQLVLGHLNVMTSTISTVVMGVGIDAGIHFFSRAKRARLEHEEGEAIRQAFDGLAIPLLVASSTTIGAFASMASSDFPAFHEFGVIAAIGVALCLLSMVTVLPALAYLVGIKKLQPRRPLDEQSLATRLILARPGLLFLALLGLSVLVAQGAQQVEFEYNVRKLQSDRARENTEPDAKLISEVFGKDIHASVVVRPNLEQTRATLEHARARHEVRKAEGTTTVAELLAAPDLLPEPGLDLERRQRRIARFKAEHEGLLEQLRERAGLPPAAPRPETPAPEDDSWDDWDGDELDGEASPEPEGAESSGAPEQPGAIGDDWDEWDGSEDDEPAEGAAEPGAAATGAQRTGEPAGAEHKRGADKPAAAAPAADEPGAVGDNWDEWDGSEDDELSGAVTPSEPSGSPSPPGDSVEEDELSVEDAELLLTMLDAKPFTVDDLPEVLLNKLRAHDGSYAIYAYPAFDVADMESGLVFMDETADYLDESASDTFVGEAVVYAAMFLMLREEAPVVLGMAAVLIAVLVFWQLRSLALMLMTLVPLALSVWWLLGVMGPIDMRFTLFNLPILPAILGIGVDNGVYLTHRIRRSAPTLDGLAEALQETGGAILAATATTAVGFAAFMVADSGGVRGIGSLAVLGIVLAAMAALLVLPTLTSLFMRRRR